MRSKDLGLFDGVHKEFSEDTTLLMYRQACLSRAFDLEAKKAFDQRLIKFPIYLSVGEEFISAALAAAYPKASIFAQHRAHDLYLSYGGSLVELIDELLGRPTGCAHGMGGSASIHSPAIGMFGHSGLMGDQIPISIGFALGSNKNVLAVMGDASAEEDYVLGAMGYAAHKKLPILFVCYDNGLSILTKVEVRRRWSIVDVAKSFGMDGVEITDDPWLIMHHVQRLSRQLPAFMNIQTVRNLWHAGTGVDGEPEWDRLALVEADLKALGLWGRAQAIKEEEKQKVEKAWQRQLQF